jgi:hypothetical protein
MTDPRTLGAIAVILVLMGVFLFFKVGARRRIGALRSAFEPFRVGLVGLLEELEALEKRHDQLPFSDLDYAEPMAGETRRTYDEIATEAERLRAEWTVLMEIRQRAATILAAATFEKGDEERVRKLLERVEELSALEERRLGCARELDRMEAAHEWLEPLFAGFAVLEARINEQLEAFRAAGLSTVPYEDEWVGCQEVLAEAQRARVSDPLGMARVVPDIHSRGDELVGWLDSVAATLSATRKLEGEFAGVRGDVERWRADGLRLDSLRSNPDALLEDGEKRCGDAVRCLDYGDAEAAEESLQGARENLDGAGKRLDAVIKAKAYYEDELPKKIAERDELESAVVVVEDQLAQLKGEYAARSWRHVEGHADQARKVLERQEPLLNDAASAATDSEQDYLRAVELLRRLERQQEHANYLLQGVAECVKHLSELRTRCRDRAQELLDDVRRLEGRAATQRAVLCDGVRRFLEDTASLLDKVRGEIGQSLPDWPIIEEHCESVSDELARVEQAMKNELEAHGRIQDVIARLGREQGQLDEFLRAHTEDRPATNSAFAAAKSRLDELATQVASGSGGEWALIERELEALAREFEAVQRGADADISLGSHAQRAVTEAEGLLQEARSRRVPGISERISRGEALLVEARRLLAEQAYERAAVSASQARDEARGAIEQALVAARAGAEQRRKQRMQTLASAAVAGSGVIAQVLVNSSLRNNHDGPWGLCRRGRGARWRR